MFETQQIITEMAEMIQTAEWTHDEGIRIKQREIDNLMGELERANTIRQDSLDTQRRDLTESYERILAQRDSAQDAKECDINRQINELSIRFEGLHTENSRVKSELAAALRVSDALTSEVADKEEARRRLQWQLDDERAQKTAAEDGVHRQLQRAQLDLAVLRDTSAKEADELRKTVDKVH